MRTLYATSVVKDSMTSAPYAEQGTRKTSWGTCSSLGGGTVGKVVCKLADCWQVLQSEETGPLLPFKGRYAINGGEILQCVVVTDN